MRKTAFFNQPNVYTTIAVLYTIRRFIPIPSIVSRVVFILFFLMSGYYLVKTILEYRSYPIVRVLSVLTILFGLYGLFMVLNPPDYSWRRMCASDQFLIDFLESLLPIYAFFYLSKKRMINERWIMIWTIIFVGAAFIVYFGMLNAIMIDASGDSEGAVNNGAYVIMSLIPCTAFFKKRTMMMIQYLLWAVILMAIIFSVKRGAILISGVAFFVFLWRSMTSAKRVKRIVVTTMSILSLLAIFYYAQYLLENTTLLSNRLYATLEGDTSERDLIYSSYYQFFASERSLFRIVFGHGAYGTLHYLGLMAHNDWLELAIDMGLLGVSVYLVYWIMLWQMVSRSRTRCSEDIYMAFLLFAILYLGKSFFSMSIMDMPVFATAPLGYCIGQYFCVINQKQHEVNH